MEIDKKTVAETLRCEKNFDCLNNDEHVYCQVESCVNKAVHFVKCPVMTPCNYKMSFGDSSICTCPVRKEIFNKYGR